MDDNSESIPVRPAGYMRFGITSQDITPWMSRPLKKAATLLWQSCAVALLRWEAPEKPHVIVIGDAYAQEAYKFAKQGCRVTMIDVADYSREVKDCNWWLNFYNHFLRIFRKEPIVFIQADVTTIRPEDLCYGKAHIVCANRVTHFFDLEKQRKFSRFLRTCTTDDAVVYTCNAAYDDTKIPIPFHPDSLRRRVDRRYTSTRNQPIYGYTRREEEIFLAAAGMIPVKHKRMSIGIIPRIAYALYEIYTGEEILTKEILGARASTIEARRPKSRLDHRRLGRVLLKAKASPHAKKFLYSFAPIRPQTNQGTPLAHGIHQAA